MEISQKYIEQLEELIALLYSEGDVELSRGRLILQIVDKVNKRKAKIPALFQPKNTNRGFGVYLEPQTARKN